MSRVFISGSSTGLGLMAGQLLLEQGHHVVLHARNQDREESTRETAPQVEAVVIGDLTSIAGTRSVAEQIDRLGHFDAVIHNAAVGYRESRRIESEDGLPQASIRVRRKHARALYSELLDTAACTVGLS